MVELAEGQAMPVESLLKERFGADNARLPSVFPLWKGADWMEREVYDMYGIEFVGHPDLRRILMPEEFTSYPLRKDYPLRGRGERHNFAALTRAES
jgi:NADH-quinone oxidoreductase subunit C